MLSRRLLIALLAEMSVLPSLEAHAAPLPADVPKMVWSYDTVAALARIEPERRIVAILGYHAPGDGGGGVFLWSAQNVSVPDEGTVFSGPSADRGRWVRLHETGDINIKWFGARGDGESDDTQAFVRARDYLKRCSRRNFARQADANRLGLGRLYMPPGSYVIRSPEAWFDRSYTLRTLGLTFAGAGPETTQILYRPQRSGPLIANNDAVLMLRFTGFSVHSEVPEATFYEAVSRGGAQDVKIDHVNFSGKWRFGFHLSGDNCNSEFRWTNVVISGSWQRFLELAGNDQLLNYWFDGVKFWADSGVFVRANQGGHIKLVNCDISGWGPKTPQFLFELLGDTHARGVCHFSCTSSRFELKTDHSGVIRSQWPHGVVEFIGCDFGSQADWRSPDAVTAKFELPRSGGPVIRWQDCTLIGRHLYSSEANSSGVPTQIIYESCTHPQHARPDQFLLPAAVTDAREAALPHIVLRHCRSEIGTFGLKAGDSDLTINQLWDADLGTLNYAGGMGRKTAMLSLSASGKSAILALPLGARVIAAQFICPTALAEQTELRLQASGLNLMTETNASSLIQTRSGTRYIVDGVVPNISKGAAKLVCSGGDILSAPPISTNKAFIGLVEAKKSAIQVTIERSADFEGAAMLQSVTQVDSKLVARFPASSASSATPQSVACFHEVRTPAERFLTFSASAAVANLRNAFCLIDYI
jgi:hypothetical protein